MSTFLRPSRIILGKTSDRAAVLGRTILNHALAAVDFPLDVAGSIPAGLLGQVAHLLGGLALELLGGVAALDVAGDEEADKEVGQGGKVQDVEPDGKGLAGGG